MARTRRIGLVPVFGVDADREALAILEMAIEDRPVIPIPAKTSF
jgi:hypothetical protein